MLCPVDGRLPAPLPLFQTVAHDLRRAALTLRTQFMDATTGLFDYKAMKASAAFAEYERVAHQLQRVDVVSLGPRNSARRMAFLINVYNALNIHATLVARPTNLVQKLAYVVFVYLVFMAVMLPCLLCALILLCIVLLFWMPAVCSSLPATLLQARRCPSMRLRMGYCAAIENRQCLCGPSLCPGIDAALAPSTPRMWTRASTLPSTVAPSHAHLCACTAQTSLTSKVFTAVTPL